jgi:hypothetical protein
MSYKKITVNLYNEQITLTPINLFLVSDPRITDSKVVIYQIDYVELTSGKTASAIIPYYISDGHTNNLRANMLYPFMSYNMNGNLNSPYLAGNDGLLFKYNIGTNIDTNSIETWVRSEFVNFYNTHGHNGQAVLQSLDAGGQNHRVGVTSVLRRLTNLLDYLISILSPAVLTFRTRDIRCYRPIFDPAQQANKYNMELCDLSSPANEHDLYKEKILIALRDQIDHLIRYRLFTTEDIALVETPISRVNFNNTISICTNAAYNQNVSNYVNISVKLHRNIKAYVTQLLQTPIALVQQSLPGIVDGSFIPFYTSFNRLLNDNTILRSPSPETALEGTIRVWGAVCRQLGSGEIADDETIGSGETIFNTNKTIKKLISSNDIRAVNGHTLTEKMLKSLYKEYKKKYLSIRQSQLK